MAAARIWSIVKDCLRALASASMRAIAPVTAGAAMLVPDMVVTPFFDPELAATTAWPGADSSGF